MASDFTMKLSLTSFKMVLLLLLVASLQMSRGLPEKLSDVEKVQMLERLAEIKASAEVSSKSRFAVALKAYRVAIKSDVASYNLYLKSVEKVDFIDQKRSSQDFRDWKRRHKAEMNTQEFRRALQHQLSWLLLSVEASVKPDDIKNLGVRALEKLDAIMEDHKILKGYRRVLEQDVLDSVFAKAYNINGLQAKDWPLSPLKISEIYDKVVMPPLRNPSGVSSLRDAWKKRIEHEGLIRKYWGKVHGSSRVGMKKDVLPAEFIKWKEEGYMQLLWKAEMDCYQSGDQKQASKNMLQHLSDHIKNKHSLKWTREFQDLMMEEVAMDGEKDGEKDEQ